MTRRWTFGGLAVLFLGLALSAAPAAQQAGPETNPLWREEKIKNYLPHMRWPEAR
jgi:hypothetical protein